VRTMISSHHAYHDEGAGAAVVKGDAQNPRNDRPVGEKMEMENTDVTDEIITNATSPSSSVAEFVSTRNILFDICMAISDQNIGGDQPKLRLEFKTEDIERVHKGAIVECVKTRGFEASFYPNICRDARRWETKGILKIRYDGEPGSSMKPAKH